MTDLSSTNADRLRALARERGRVAAVLTTIMIVIYFGFIALIGFDKPLLGRRIGSGLSLGIILGALVIVASWLLTWVYVRWMNAHYDTALQAIESGKGRGGKS
ncbi:MAG TPA: DUF485 domain-containing protein [Gemmatimonadaceae bacterium]|nr:DUF485 domain-containing protein [Gemmatimonadaceae bacterium]